MNTPENRGAKKFAKISENLYTLSFIGQYVASFWQYLISTGIVIQTAGKFFPPIAYAFDGLRAFFNLFIGNETTEITPGSPVPINSKRDLYARRAANATVLLLDIVVVLALAGVLLTNPIGWAIATVATFIGWMGDAVLPAWQARKEYLATPTKAAEKKYLQKRNDAVWGFVAVAAMILFACGPFGFGAIGLIGSALFVVIAVRGIVNGISEWRQNRKNPVQVSVGGGTDGPQITYTSTPAITSVLAKNTSPTDRNEQASEPDLKSRSSEDSLPDSIKQVDSEASKLKKRTP